MNLPELKVLLDRFGSPMAYNHFLQENPPEPPYLVYRVLSETPIYADSALVYRSSLMEVELYGSKKDPEAEARLEKLLGEGGFTYLKSEDWDSGEKLFIISYEFEMEESTT